MNKLLSSNIFETISEYLNEAKQSVYVMAPFINESSLVKLLDSCADKRVNVITSWKKEYLLTGVSSIKLFDVCRLNNWNLFICDNLHAKIYSADLKSAFLGSANCTEKGMMDLETSNIECMTLLDPLSSKDRIEINKIILSSLYVTEAIYERYAEWMKNKHIVKNTIVDEGEFYLEPKLFTSLLPATKSPEELWKIISNPSDYDDDSLKRAEHDMALFTRSDVSSMSELLIDAKSMALKNRFIDKYLKSFEVETYFGETTAWIHNNCDDDPAPYRKEVKQLVGNLFNWLPQLFDEFEVSIPGQKSQRLRRK